MTTELKPCASLHDRIMAIDPPDLGNHKSDDKVIYLNGFYDSRKAAAELCRATEAGGWIDPDTATFRLSEGEKVVAFLQSMKVTEFYEVLEYVAEDDCDFKTEDGFDIANNWDIIKVMPLPPLPDTEADNG